MADVARALNAGVFFDRFHLNDPTSRPDWGFHEIEEADFGGQPVEVARAAAVAAGAGREAAGGAAAAQAGQEPATELGGGGDEGERVYQPGLGTWTGSNDGAQDRPKKNPLAHTADAETLKDWAKRVWTEKRELARILFDGCKEESRRSTKRRPDTFLGMLGFDDDESDDGALFDEDGGFMNPRTSIRCFTSVMLLWIAYLRLMSSKHYTRK
eukprot:g11343.t1